MASGQESVELRSSQRQQKKRQYPDYVTNTPENQHKTTNKQNEQCNKCYELFCDKKSLTVHQKKCLALSSHDSFGKHVFNNKPYDTTGKVVVSSQPLSSPPRTPTSTPSPSSRKQPPLTPRKYAAAISATVNIVPLKHARPLPRNAPATRPKKATPTSPVQSHDGLSPNDGLEKSTPTTSTTGSNVSPTKISQPKKSTLNRPTIAQAQKPQTKKSATTTIKTTTQTAPTTAPTPNTAETPTIDSANAPEADEVESVYGEITQWRRNLFNLPKGNLGKKFVEEKTKLLNQWVTSNEEQSLMLLMMMPNLLLQRTSQKTKARENKNHLERRLKLWEEGKLSDLVEEGKCIQSRLPTIQRKQTEK